MAGEGEVSVSETVVVKLGGQVTGHPCYRDCTHRVFPLSCPATLIAGRSPLVARGNRCRGDTI